MQQGRLQAGAKRQSGLAGALLAVGACALLLSGCAAIDRRLNENHFWKEATGQFPGRQPPPGLNGPYPNLASVPPRPPFPDPRGLEAITRQLEAERGASNQPFEARTTNASATGAGAGAGAGISAGKASPGLNPGDPAIPAGPPPRAALAKAAPITLAPTPFPAATTGQPAGAASGLPAAPGAVPPRSDLPTPSSQNSGSRNPGGDGHAPAGLSDPGAQAPAAPPPDLLKQP